MKLEKAPNNLSLPSVITSNIQGFVFKSSTEDNIMDDILDGDTDLLTEFFIQLWEQGP